MRHGSEFWSLLFLAAVFYSAVHAEIRLGSDPKGIKVQSEELGAIRFKGPVLSFKHEGKDGEWKSDPAYTPDAGGLAGTITYPGSPGGAGLRYRISPHDQTIFFEWDFGALSAFAADFEMQFLSGQFLGGSYAIGDKAPVGIPVDHCRTEFFFDKAFRLAGRDGLGLLLKTPGGNTGFKDDRKYGAQNYTWNYRYAFKSSENSFALQLADFKTDPPPVVLKPVGPPAGGKWEPIPELSDEFEGDTLDAGKWNNGDPRWLGRQPSFFSPGNVQVKEGQLCLTAKLEEPPEAMKAKGYHSFTTACVTSKTLALYGYYEIKAKIMDAGICNAFWFWNSDGKMASEIDVFEICGGKKEFERTLFHTLHVAKPADGSKPFAKSTQFRTARRLADDYHVFGLEWGKEEIKCYVDGYLFSKIPNTHWHQPLTMDFDSEVNLPWFGEPDKKALPAVYSVQYVRAWRRVEEPSSGSLAP